ncbi:uncharacterized protein [Periplaneta americana]|uniref:uncharacterized protein n=1 Tax=Periplaneta americana TaxID=6978 RepID=UPI0037E74BC2
MGTTAEEKVSLFVSILFLSISFLPVVVLGQGCALKSYGTNKWVCVCNATYCDNLIPPEELMQDGYYLQYTSTNTGKRLVPMLMEISNEASNIVGELWQITSSTKYQEMIGFGGAFTDSVGINLGTLTSDVSQLLLNQYYGPNGIGYTMARCPMGGTDFSTRFYTYDDGPVDMTLSRFSLAEEDYKYKIPYLKYIKGLQDVKLLTTPWSPPEWMIEPRNGSIGYTKLGEQYYQVYAEYFVNYLLSYQEEDLNFWSINTQNEPGNGYDIYFGINSCGYSPQEELNFLVGNLAPTLEKNGFGNITIMNCEDQRPNIPEWAEVILSNASASQFTKGTSVHWYQDDLAPASRLTELHEAYPDKYILYTESSFIAQPDENAVLFGDWARANTLGKDMIDVFNNWVVGWLDWNICLDTTGGPSYLQNYLDAFIVVNATANEFYKQPIYYIMAHSSKFVLPGSVRIAMNSTADSGIGNVAFLRPDNIVAVVLLNRLLFAFCTKPATCSTCYLSQCQTPRAAHLANMWAPFLLLLPCLLTVGGTPCRKLKLPEEASHVCVCNARQCDEIEQQPESILRDGMYLHYISSSAGRRLDLNSGQFVSNPFPRLRGRRPVVMRVDTSRRYQEIYGFGGAMTDAAGLNIATLSKATQETLIRQYFGSKGIGYSFVRVPFGGTDFSTYNYTYADVENDLTLQYFSLKYEDIQYKIPYIKMAQRMSPRPLKLFSASWSAPEWMKELRNGTVGYSRLRREFHRLYAEYLIRCLDEYKKNGLEFWGISPQNEPFHGTEVYYNFNSMGWRPEEQTEWIANFFGPALQSKGYGKLKLLILDDNRTFLPGWARAVLGNERAAQYVSGIAIHWYFDFQDPGGQKLSQTHYEFPNYFLLYTESSVIPIMDTSVPNAKPVRLGNWERAENYTSNIIEDINHWVTGWVDWNMALDTEGGPNWAGNQVEAPIIVNATADEFYKQPMFYALAHFAKFVPPGSRRIAYKISNDSIIECVSFLRPDNIVAIVLQNRRNVDVDVVILLQNRRTIVVPAPAHSMHTVLYKPTVGNQYSPRTQNDQDNNPGQGNQNSPSPGTQNGQTYNPGQSNQNRPTINNDQGFQNRPNIYPGQGNQNKPSPGTQNWQNYNPGQGNQYRPTINNGQGFQNRPNFYPGHGYQNRPTRFIWP